MFRAKGHHTAPFCPQDTSSKSKETGTRYFHQIIIVMFTTIHNPSRQNLPFWQNFSRNSSFVHQWCLFSEYFLKIWKFSRKIRKFSEIEQYVNSVNNFWKYSCFDRHSLHSQINQWFKVEISKNVCRAHEWLIRCLMGAI